MQAEKNTETPKTGTTKKIKKVPKAKPEEEMTRDEVKQMLLRKGPLKLTKADKKKLDEIAAEEEHEERVGALQHRLQERADKWGRRQIGAIKREVTDRVAKVNREELAELSRLRQSNTDAVAQAKAEAKAEMTRIQEELDRKLKNLVSNLNEAEQVTRANYRPQYDEAEAEITTRVDEVTDTVAAFIESIQDLTVEQLEDLHKEGVINIGDECFAVPDVSP